MKTIVDNREELDLNPRQFYIILREDNTQYHEFYKSIAKASENDDIRFCIIDATECSEPTFRITALYHSFMGIDEENSPWDFIIRNYPDDGNFTFSCWHRLSDDEKEIEKDLKKWKETQEKRMWHSITNRFCGYFEKNTSSQKKIKEFYDILAKTMHNRGLTSQQQEKELDRFCNLGGYADDASIKLVKDFVGDNINIIDNFFNVKTPRNISDEYMRCFFETGGYIKRPTLKIIHKSSPVVGGKVVFGGKVHDKYGLQVTTTSGRTEEVCFTSSVAFSMYIFHMFNPYIKIKKDDFNPKYDPKTAKHYWETLLTIYATIGESLEYKEESIKRLRKLYKDFFTESKKIWSNSHKDKDAFMKLGAEAEPFQIQPPEDNVPKPKRWLNLSEDYIDLSDSSFNRDYKTNLKIIENSNLFQTFEKERNENTL